MTPAVRYQSADVAELPTLWSGDVAVVGGGSAGSTAAVAAARTGARTLLIESGAFLGGIGTRVLDTFYGFYAPGPEGRRVVGGIPWEVCERLQARGMAFERPNTYGAGTGITYEPEALKLVWDELTVAAHVDVLLYGLATAAVVDDQAIVGIVVETRRGPGRVDASVFIDSSGDGEIAWRAGASIAHEQRLQPATATFRVGGVAESPATTQQLHDIMAQAAASGRYRLPRLEGSTHATCLPGVRHTNLTRISGLDLTDPWQLTAAEQEGRRQVAEYQRLLREQVPGYESSYLLQASSRLGIRETRRLAGEYVLTREDVLTAADHPEGIARCGAPVEDHAYGSATRWEYVGGGQQPTGRTYAIPYGSLLPRDVDGLLVAGRCLSATHDAHASVRSIGQCMAMGHAAGLAAAIAAAEHLSPRKIDRAALRRRLLDQGALL